MNLVLFQEQELALPLHSQDRRAIHILKVLSCREGDSFDAGIVNGLQGKGKIRSVRRGGIQWDFFPVSDPPPLHPVTLLVGLPRPQSARRILREATSLGVRCILFAFTDKGERSYGGSRLWKNGEYTKYLVEGAELAFTTRIPDLGPPRDLREVIDSLPAHTDGMLKAALDNYEAELPLRDLLGNPDGKTTRSAVIAVGAERGWSDRERRVLRDSGFILAGIGQRVLRTETASLAGLVLVLSYMELM